MEYSGIGESETSPELGGCSQMAVFTNASSGSCIDKPTPEGSLTSSYQPVGAKRTEHGISGVLYHIKLLGVALMYLPFWI